MTKTYNNENRRNGSLSQRERQVLGLVAQGYNNPAIAKALTIKLESVETYMCKLYTKLMPVSETGRWDRRVKLALIGASQSQETVVD